MSKGPQYEVGRYVGRIASQALGQAKTGTTQFMLRVAIEARIVTGPEGEELENVDAGERTLYMAITDKTMSFVTGDLVAIGYTKTSLKYLDPNAEGFQDFSGKEVELWCAHESYEGSLREKWRINRKAADVKPVDQKALRGLDVLFGKALKTAGAKPVEASPSTSPKANAELQEAMADGGDDSIPF